jgi:pimeloyl-ACP methyl ester carboxylesterase
MKPCNSNAPRGAKRRIAKDSGADEPDWAFHATNTAVFDALAKGQHNESLREYFGTPAYKELCMLAASPKRRERTGATQVLIVPGIMGSRLGDTKRSVGSRIGGSNRRAPRGASGAVLWIDPRRIAAGRLTDLKLPSVKSIRPMGVLLFSYAKLKLQLEIGGFDAKFFPYDWRLGIDELGAALASTIAADGKPAVLIAHSMGGLIARVATKLLPKRYVHKLILLGTPNQGSYAPVQALRGTYPFMRRMARLDRHHTAEYLAQKVFCTFPGIYHLLPPAKRGSKLDLLDPRCWPSVGPKPDATLLTQVAAVHAQLAAPDARMMHIVGVNRETVIGVRRTATGFEYRLSVNGDGTVPVARALLPRLKTYFVDEAHGNLANNSQVIRAIIDLLRHGRTRELARRFVPRRSRPTGIDDARLRLVGAGKIDWRRLDSAQREAALKDLDAT